MRTAEQQAEWDKCSTDPIYFLNRYTYFYKYSPLLADYKLYSFQEDLINTLESENQVVVNTCRQMGISTTVMGYIFWRVNFKENYTAVILNTNKIQSIRNLDILRKSWESLPVFLRTTGDNSSKSIIRLDNGSKIKAKSGQAADASCGENCDIVFMDNAAFIGELGDQYSAFLQNLKSGGKMIIASTLYRKGFFLDKCREGEAGTTNFKYVKLPYYLHPKRNRLWRDNQEYALGHNAAIVECDCTHYYDEDMSIKPLIED